MDKKEQQKDFNGRVEELFAFAKEKEVFIGAVQKVSENGYIEIVPLFKDLKQYVRDVEAKTTSETSGTPSPDEFLPDNTK